MPLPRTPTPGAPHLDKALLSAWLLVHLIRGERHGWALLADLGKRGISVDSSRVYREMRELETAGHVSSRWTPSVGGPQRRAYRLTGVGQTRLEELAANLAATWRMHDDFLKAYEREHVGDGDGVPHERPGADETPGDGTPSSMGRELMAAWLLLVLEDGASYGYDLRRALEDHGIHPDPGTLYRVLRKLDGAGWLQSRWMESAAGPRRRFYRVTGRGRRRLSDVAELVVGIRDGHALFLDAYAATRSGETPEHDDHSHAA